MKAGCRLYFKSIVIVPHNSLHNISYRTLVRSHPKGMVYSNIENLVLWARILNSGFGLNEIVNCDKFISIIRGHFIRLLNDVIYILAMCDPKNEKILK